MADQDRNNGDQKVDIPDHKIPAGDKGNDRQAVIDQFFKIKDRDSVLGKYSIDQNGDTNQGSMTVDVAKGGKLVTYKVLTPPSNLVETFH